MEIPKLKIGGITADIPIVQGGMGVRVSLSSLVSAVANEGGIGTIASVGLGDLDALEQEFEKECRENLIKEIHKAREKSNGHIAVNVMAALSNADDLIKAAVNEGIKLIMMGAGLPLRLPRLIEDDSVNLLPIVSSGRAASLILSTWDKRYERTADGIILEGPLAGGHLGFSLEQLKQPEKYSLDILLPKVLEVVKVYEDKYGRKIPVITAGGIFTGQDIARMLSKGASGVQMATRFVCTEECDVSQEFKQAYLEAEKEDINIIQSPVGLPGRAIRNKFLKDLEIKGRLKIRCPYRCLSACKVSEARYCIALALLNSYFGDVDHGLIFAGENAYRINKIVTVKELIAELLAELAAA
ncbi:MAG: nitronate monooxygenase [Fidelibacterota bacterium]|nr:MAG: nitronate monooxygenase [Candidatus Neomarinimicrobiota bacterium]